MITIQKLKGTNCEWKEENACYHLNPKSCIEEYAEQWNKMQIIV